MLLLRFQESVFGILSPLRLPVPPSRQGIGSNKVITRAAPLLK